MDKVKNPAVVGAGQYGSQPCYAPQLSALASGVAAATWARNAA
jgi:hypothetical protein